MSVAAASLCNPSLGWRTGGTVLAGGGGAVGKGSFSPSHKAWHLPGEHQQPIRLCWGSGKTPSSGAWLPPSALCDVSGRRAGLKISDPLDVSLY